MWVEDVNLHWCRQRGVSWDGRVLRRRGPRRLWVAAYVCSFSALASTCKWAVVLTKIQVEATSVRREIKTDKTYEPPRRVRSREHPSTTLDTLQIDFQPLVYLGYFNGVSTRVYQCAY